VAVDMAERKSRSMSEMQQEANASEPKGIPCPNCGSTVRRVWTTRRGEGYIMRETICQACQHKRITIER
jgi:formamidopyrimidine-DNA glycosylase